LDSKGIDEESSKSVSGVLGQEVVTATEIKPTGRDELCGYLTGQVVVTSEGETTRASMAACITSVSSRAMMIYAYGPVEQGTVGPARRAKAVAATLIEQNEAK